MPREVMPPLSTVSSVLVPPGSPSRADCLMSSYIGGVLGLWCGIDVILARGPQASDRPFGIGVIPTALRHRPPTIHRTSGGTADSMMRGGRTVAL